MREFTIVMTIAIILSAVIFGVVYLVHREINGDCQSTVEAITTNSGKKVRITITDCENYDIPRLYIGR